MKTAKSIRNHKKTENRHYSWMKFMNSQRIDDRLREIDFLKAKIKRYKDELEWIIEAFGTYVNPDYSNCSLKEHIEEFYDEDKKEDEWSAFIVLHS